MRNIVQHCMLKGLILKTFRMGIYVTQSGLVTLLLALPAWAETSDGETDDVSYLVAHESNTLGYTLDYDDVAFLDVKLSIKTPIAPRSVHKISEDLDLYLGLTGRFGQYIGTRESSPVIAKRFNPEMFLRYRFSNETHVDLGYAHESNGQAITSPEEFDLAQMNAEQEEFAKDQISRGWDYIRLSLKRSSTQLFNSNFSLNAYLALRYFIPNGFLQGDIEEYDDWENDPEGKPRDEVNGVQANLEFIRRFDNYYLSAIKAAVIYETGYNPIFRYNSIRIELGFKTMELPMILWMSSGYNSDLAQYYKKVLSIGAAYEIGAF